MKHLKIDEHGPQCPNCGGRQFALRGALQWNPGKAQCIGCGKAFLPAKKADVKRLSR